MTRSGQETSSSHLCKPALCTACGACVNACPFEAIGWRKNEFEEQYPFISADLCRNCGACDKACPQLSEMRGSLPLQSYGCWVKSVDDLAKSSSGGAARALSMAVIEKGGIVFGCAFVEGRNHHLAVGTVDGLDDLSGSKYVWSDVEYCHRGVREHLLKQDKSPVLFIGTPCQVDGLKRFLGPLQDSPSFFTVDLICHGTPPPDYLKDFVKDTEGDEPERVVCRDRFGGALHGVLKNGREFHHSGGFECSMYLQAYVRGMTYRERCYACRYATPRRIGDVTLGDYWGISRKYIPEKSPEVISIAYINTDRGRELFDCARPLLEYHSVPSYEAVTGKPNMLRPQKRPAARNAFLKLLPDVGFTEAVRRSLHPAMASAEGVKRLSSSMAKEFAKFCCQIAYWLFFRFDSHILNQKDKAKIVRLTTSDDEFLFSDYGVFFQNYAFRRTLASWGYVAYRQDRLLNHAGSSWDNSGKWVKSLAVVAWLHEIIGRLRHRPVFRFSVYQRLRQSYSRLIAPCFEYCDAKPDACIVFGDMVFHTRSKALDAFGEEIGNEALKIAYAASGNWGGCMMDNLWQLRARELFPQFKALSVCGDEGRALCRKTASVSAYDAIDPILLLQKKDYEAIMTHDRIFGNKNMLCWFDEKAFLSETSEDFWNWLETNFKLEIKMTGRALLDGGTGENRKSVFFPAPLDFLRSVHDAAFIMTDCWQGIVFSLLFERPFVCVIGKEKERFSKISKVRDLLKRVDSMERICDVADAATIGALLEKEIDWTKIRARIGEWRRESLDWLKNALQD